MRTQAIRLPVRVTRSFVRDHSAGKAHPRHARLCHVFDLGAGRGAEPAQRLGIGVERVRGQMEADSLGLECQPLQSAASPAYPAGAELLACRAGAAPNSAIWPLPFSSAVACARRRIASAAANRRARFASSGSNAPARIRFSSCMRLSWRGSTRGAKSARSANGLSPRASASACIAAKPTFFTAASA